MEDFNLSIIIPVFNNINFTKLALEGLTKLSNKYEIIIVDNNSTDNTFELVNSFIKDISKESARVKYVHCPNNLGFGAANNKGYKHSEGKNILFLNNDIRIEKDFKTWPNDMVKLAEQGYLVGTQGALLDEKFNFIKEGSGLKQTDYWYLGGWCVCGSRATFDKLILDHYCNSEGEIVNGKAWGPWNEKFFLYFEDGDLTWRAKKLGIEIVEIQVPIHHFGRVTGKKYSMFGYYKISRRIFINEWKEKYK